MNLQQALESTTLKAVAEVCGVSITTVWRWRESGKLPRTEWTGETNYASAISALTGVPRDKLLMPRAA